MIRYQAAYFMEVAGLSDYVKEKVIRLPLPESLWGKLEDGTIEDYFRGTFGDLWEGGVGTFTLSNLDNRVFLDYLVGRAYVEGEWGFAWYLTKADEEKYKELFDRGKFDYDVKDLRKVAYCFYDGCEPYPYYDPEEITFENI